MKNILFVSHTYYQVITMIQMRLTLFKDAKTTAIISDSSNNAEKVFNRLKAMSIFEKCYFIKIKEELFRKKTSLDKIRQIPMFVSGNGDIWDSLPLGYYDEIIYYNQDEIIFSLYAKLYRENQNLKVSRFEEGIFSYGFGTWPSLKCTIAQVIRKVLGRKNLEEAYSNYYCYYPELYHGTMAVIPIPSISEDNGLSNILQKVFNLNFNQDDYRYRYIYFSSTLGSEGKNPIGELELVKRIAELVGNDNLLVKVHPRDDASRFIDAGMNVDIHSNVPWEAIQMGMDFSQHVFLSITSNSAITMTLLQDKPPKVFYMYKLCNTGANSHLQKCIESVESVIFDEFMNDKKIQVYVAKKLEDILN